MLRKDAARRAFSRALKSAWRVAPRRVFRYALPVVTGDETWTDFDGPSWIQYDLFHNNKLPGSKRVNLVKFMLRAVTGLKITVFRIFCGQFFTDFAQKSSTLSPCFHLPSVHSLRGFDQNWESLSVIMVGQIDTNPIRRIIKRWDGLCRLFFVVYRQKITTVNFAAIRPLPA